MSRSYAAMTTLVTTKLQSSGTVDFSVAEVDYQIEEDLKEIAYLSPHIIPIMFYLESRNGSDVTGTASSLTDAIKSQFLAADATNEKVVHNKTDDSWAVVLTYTSTSILTLSADIMDANEEYEIFNKRCWNKRQVYIGDILPEILGIESVEYPIGTKRNFRIVSEGVLEIDCDNIPDSNTNVDNLPNVTVLVRFIRPHILSQMTDLSGLVAGTSGVAGNTTMSVSGLTASGTVESGSEFTIENLRGHYIVTADATATTAGIAAIGFYPGLETAAASATVVTFTKSTLKPYEEVAFANIVAGHLMVDKANKFTNSVPIGGGGVWSNYYTLGQKMIDSGESKLRVAMASKTVKRYSSE